VCWNIYYGHKADYFFVIDGKLNPTMKNKRKWKDQQGQKVEYLFFIDGKLSPTMTNKRKWQDQQHNDDGMER
jgi:hypothetical protein